MNLLAAYYHDQPKEPITSRFGFVSRGITGAGRIEMGTFVAVVLLFSLSLSLSATTTNRNKPLIFQARITDLSRVRLADGTYNMKFKIWDAASGGSCLWATGSNESSGSANCASAGNVSVSVVRGVMVVQLGDDNASVTNMPPMNLDFDSSSYYLGMTVEADAEMTPRTRIGAGAYAYNADELDALNSGSFLRSDADDQTTSLITLAYTPAGTGVGQGPVYINPSSASTNYKLLNILINGSSKLSIDAEGDLTTAGNLTVSGTSDNSMTGNMIWSADNTYDIGASGANRPRRGYFATEVVVGGTVTISTNSIVGSGATTLSSTSGNLTLSTVTSGDIVLTPTGSGKVGVGTASPAAKLQVTAGSGIDVLKLVADATDALFVSSAGYTGVGTVSPATRLDVAGLTVNTDADGTVAAMRNTATFTKNDSNTRTFSVAKIVPTFNFGGSNTNTTVNVLDIDSTNTAVTGLTTNLLKASYGGTQKFLVDSSGNVTIAGGISSIGGSILPSTDDTYDLGSSSFRWRDLFLGPSSLRLSTTTGETGTARAWKVGVDETNGATDGNFRIMEGSSQYLTIGTSGNVGIGTGATDPASLLHVAGIAQLGTASTTTGQLKLFNSGSANATIWQAGSVTTSYTLTWPTGYGSDTNILTTNGSGVLSWSAGGGGTNGWADDGTTVRLSTATDSVAIGTTTAVSKLTIEGGGISIGGFAQVGRANMRAPLGNTISTVDSTGDVSQFNSLTVAPDGLPIISYYDVANANMKIAKCGNVTCSSGNTVTTIDSTGDVGYYSSITIGTDGLPVVAYLDNTNGDLKVAKCGNAACSSGNTISSLDTSSVSGHYPSITIGTDGYPVISYQEGAGDLKVAKCGNAACSSGETITNIDSANNTGAFNSIAIGTDGFPVISYEDATTNDLRVAKCGNAACSSGNTLTTVDSTGSLGRWTSITIAPDGLPVVSYFDATNSDLKVAKCGNAVCNSGNTTTTPDSANTTGEYTAITIGADGLPLISYYYGWTGDLRIMKCGDATCSSGNITYDPDTTGSVGLYTSLAVGADGLPIIAYRDSTNADLKALHCGNQYCLPSWTRR